MLHSFKFELLKDKTESQPQKQLSGGILINHCRKMFQKIFTRKTIASFARFRVCRLTGKELGHGFYWKSSRTFQGSFSIEHLQTAVSKTKWKYKTKFDGYHLNRHCISVFVSWLDLTLAVIPWSQLVEMKFCPILLGSWHCYKLFHRLYLAITCEKLNYGKAGSLFYNVRILLCRDKIFPYDCFNPSKWNETVT